MSHPRLLKVLKPKVSEMQKFMDSPTKWIFNTAEVLSNKWGIDRRTVIHALMHTILTGQRTYIAAPKRTNKGKR